MQKATGIKNGGSGCIRIVYSLEIYSYLYNLTFNIYYRYNIG